MVDLYDGLDADHLDGDVDCCRVCRAGGSNERPLHYPCVCTGSIKYIHQECLVLWLKHSKKEYCELCNHKFTFKPVYAPDMPKSIPMLELLQGLGKNILHALRFWLHYTLVIVAWLGAVPLSAYRVYRCLFAGSIQSLFILPSDFLSFETLLLDIIYGCVVVGVTFGAFLTLLWLREQFNIHGGPEWLNEDVPPFQLNVLARNFIANHVRGNQVPPEQNEGEQAEDEAEEELNEDVDGADEVPQEAGGEQANENDQRAVNEADVNFLEAGWNPDAIIEELTWEKFLGIDGSFVFLEHVFWIISLNTTFILVFAFCPFHLGHFVFNCLQIEKKFVSKEFDSVLTLLVGYFVVTAFLALFHTILRFTSFNRLRKTVGLCYIVMKVSLLMISEIGIFPFICGWWLDICSLPLFKATLKERKESFLSSPGTAAFLHWLAGMLYVFYFAAFIMLLREVLRPGVLWFLRNINDPQYYPVKEMIRFSVIRHVRRFVLSLVVFGSTVLVLVWMPVQLVKATCKTIIPYNVNLKGDSPISEMSLEVVLLHVILPSFLEQGHARRWLKLFLQFWFRAAAHILDMSSYIFGDVDLKDADSSQIVYVDNNGKWQRGAMPRGTALENSLERVGSPVVRAYIRNDKFYFKLTIFVTCAVVSFILGSFTCLTLPVVLGRYALSLVFHDAVLHELYTAAAGCYIVWLVLRLATIVCGWYPAGLQTFVSNVKRFSLVILKTGVTACILFGIIPLLLGTLFELVFVIPLRVPLDQTPLLYLWQDWALGILHLKIMCAILMVGPDWWLKAAIERVYRDGIMNINLGYILRHIVAPVVCTLLLAITLPYAFTVAVMPLLGFNQKTVYLVLRQTYPILMCTVLSVAVLLFQGKQFKLLYEKIKNDKYLIGKVLVNYDHKNNGSRAEEIKQE